MRCHRGHVNSAGLWNCPECTDPKLDTLRITLPALKVAVGVLRGMGAPSSKAARAASEIERLLEVSK